MQSIMNNAESIIAALIIFNISLSAAQKILEVVKDKTQSEVDNKIYAFIAKYSSYIQKGIDWISANRQHK